MKTHATLGSLFFTLVALTMVGCSSKPETLVEGGYDQAEMAAAIERARSEVDDFIAELKRGNSDSYSVKAPIEEDGETEHFWLVDITYANNTFTGTIGNDPGIVSSVALGDKHAIGKTEISDWMYMRDGKMYGNYTMRPLLATMPKEQAEQLRAILATE